MKAGKDGAASSLMLAHITVPIIVDSMTIARFLAASEWQVFGRSAM